MEQIALDPPCKAWSHGRTEGQRAGQRMETETKDKRRERGGERDEDTH